MNHVSWSSCVGNQLPHAVGAAMAVKYRGDRIVIMAYLGDGATSTSDFHAAMNFAGVYKPPVVFLCQNNQWSISVPISRQTASASLAKKAVAYGMPGMRVDGNDVLAVYAASKEAVDRARGGEGPSFIEALTYRLGAHSSADDPSRYREEREVEAWRSGDPINRFRKFLKGRKLLDDKKDEEFEEELEEQIAQAIRFAEKAKRPQWESILVDVYREETWNLAEQKAELSKVLKKRSGD